MPWKDAEPWISIPIIAGMLGIFWRGVAVKTDKLDKELSHYVSEKACITAQELMTLRLEKAIQSEMTGLKNDIFHHLRKLENAILKNTGVEIDDPGNGSR